MTLRKTVILAALTGLLAGLHAAPAALAQSAAPTAPEKPDMFQRNVNQQTRIDQGLESGALNVREAGRLERQEAAVSRMEAKALKDGEVTGKEAGRIDKAQDRVSRDIYRQKHDAQQGNPDSVSSRRMQANVQRNLNQQERIRQGVESGRLTSREAGRLERGQAHVYRKEARAARDGHVGPREQLGVQRAENRQSAHVWRQKHDARRLAR